MSNLRVARPGRNALPLLLADRTSFQTLRPFQLVMFQEGSETAQAWMHLKLFWHC